MMMRLKRENRTTGYYCTLFPHIQSRQQQQQQQQQQ